MYGNLGDRDKHCFCISARGRVYIRIGLFGIKETAHYREVSDQCIVEMSKMTDLNALEIFELSSIFCLDCR